MTDLIFLDRCLRTNREYSYAYANGTYFLFHVTFNSGVSMYQQAFPSLNALLDFYYSLEVVRTEKPKASILTLAAKIINKTAMGLWSAIEKAKTVLKKKTDMSKGVATFTFRKKSNNEARKARATTNLDLIPEAHRPTGTTTKTSNPINTTIPFFDLDKSAWRCFLAESILY